MADDSTLLARLQRLEDLAEIERLFYEYRRHLDARDMYAYSRLFCEDGEWTGRTGSAVGPKQIQEMLEANRSLCALPSFVSCAYVFSNTSNAMDGRPSTALCRARKNLP